jgi:hypothetical protein
MWYRHSHHPQQTGSLVSLPVIGANEASLPKLFRPFAPIRLSLCSRLSLKLCRRTRRRDPQIDLSRRTWRTFGYARSGTRA